MAGSKAPMTTATATAARLRAYWVSCAGELRSADGAFHDDDPELDPFLFRLTHELEAGEETHNPAVSVYADGTMVIASVLRGSSDGNAIDFAKAAFEEAVLRAGGGFRDGDNADEYDDWKATRLLRWTNHTVEQVDLSLPTSA